VLAPRFLQMPCQLTLHGGRQHRNAILRSLAVSDDDEVRPEVDVVDAEACAFEQTQARTVEEQRHEPGNAREMLKDGAHLVAGHDDGHAMRPPGADEVVQPGQVLPEHLAVEEEQRPQRLILRGGGHLARRQAP
jgi:hypothetical protein